MGDVNEIDPAAGALEDELLEDELLEDELLAVRCQLGEPAAFDRLVERWHEPLWRYIRRLTDGDETAADTVQDVWLRVLRAMPRLRDPARLRAWLFGIARRAVMDRVRQRYAEPEALAVDAVDEVDLAAPGPRDDLAEELGLMHEGLARLPLVEREVLVLFYLEELTLVQLAEVLDVPVGTVKSRLFRARQLLRRHLLAKGVQR
jgi:RNA polymerase sigma-70 factor (ECF subfamily)